MVVTDRPSDGLPLSHKNQQVLQICLAEAAPQPESRSNCLNSCKQVLQIAEGLTEHVKVLVGASVYGDGQLPKCAYQSGASRCERRFLCFLSGQFCQEIGVTLQKQATKNLPRKSVGTSQLPDGIGKSSNR